jgi:hypothetical protein
VVVVNAEDRVRFMSVEAPRELARFFQIAQARGSMSTMMPACPVDTFWHQFQTDVIAFSSFCIEHANGQVAHREAKGSGRVEWADLYQSMFGESLPEIWFCTPDSESFDQDAWEASRLGEVRLSWDCTPEISQTEPHSDFVDGVVLN